MNNFEKVQKNNLIEHKIKDLRILPDSQVRELLSEQSEQSIAQSALLEPSMPYEKGYFEHYCDGIYYIVYDDEGEIKFKIFICSSLTIKARTRDEYSEKWGVLCEWRDRDGKLHDLPLPISLLQGDSREYRKLFADRGLVISTHNKAQSYLDAYLNLHPTSEMALCTHKTGWHGEQFVLPHRVFGVGQAIVYQAESTPVTHYAQKGTLTDWRQQISIPMATQHKVAFAIACAFAGQLLPLVNENGGGFHFVGTSSKGKSLTAKLACSVWGHPKSYIHSWRATSNAQENIAFQHNHGFIALDEINLANPNTIGDVTYMLADGEGKDRMNKTGQNRPTLQWQVMYLSTGEETLEAIQNRVNKHTKAGQEVRFVNLDAVTDDHLGIFDSLIGYATPAEQADALSQSASENYGTAGIAWLEYLTEDKAEVTHQALAMINKFLLPYKNLSSQARRVGRLFAMVASAGELATQAGITGWQVGQATSATQQCFENWLDNFGRDGNQEERQIIKHIRLFIQQHGESRFSNWESDGFYQKVNNRVGFLTKDQGSYLFFKDAFTEVCQPFQVKTVISVLKKHKLLRINESTRNTFKITLPNSTKSGRYYAILPSILHYEIGESNDTLNSTGITGNMGNTVNPSAFDSHLRGEHGSDNLGTLGNPSPTIPNQPTLSPDRPTSPSLVASDGLLVSQ